MKRSEAWVILILLFVLGFIWGGWKVAVTIPLVLVITGAIVESHERIKKRKDI